MVGLVPSAKVTWWASTWSLIGPSRWRRIIFMSRMRSNMAPVFRIRYWFLAHGAVCIAALVVSAKVWMYR